ncbi:MAG: tetratricopeptide repeat protein [Mangrovibacterium sp.]|jgi:tetratricopeptide (TPR) repeat protein
MKSIVFIVVFVLGAYLGFAQNAADMITKANEALTAKEYGKAFELYENAVKNLGDAQVDPAIYFYIGFAAFEADKFAEALPYLDKAIAANDNVAKAYEYKGNAYFKLDKYDEAVSAYKKAIEAGSKNKGSLYYNAGIAAYEGQKFDQAVELFGQAASANYNADNAYYYKAASLKELDKDDELKQTLVEAAAKFPQEEKITSALANIYVLEGNELYKKGVSIINAANEKVKAGTLKTKDAAYITELNKSKAEFKAALEILKKAKALDATNANAEKLIDACNSLL